MNKNVKNVRHAKKSPEFYREIWRLHVCGLDAVSIADLLQTSEPTVRRTLKRTRENKSPHILNLLFQEGRDARIADMLLYDELAAVLTSFYHGHHTTDFNAYHSCLTACPQRLSPKDFTKKHVTYRHHEFGRYVLNFIEGKNDHSWRDEIDKFRFCRSCPLGRHKNEALRPYQSNQYLYAQTMAYFASHRMRGVTERDLMLMHSDIFTIQMIHEICLRRLQQAVLDGKDDQAAMDILEESFKTLTAKLWEEIAKYM